MKLAGLIVIAVSLAACGGVKQTQKSPAPKALVEIAPPQCLMSLIKPTGSPCLDALRLHLKIAGCRKTGTTGDQFVGPVYTRCISGVVSAPYDGVFILSPTSKLIRHPALRPWCVDPVMAISTGQISPPPGKGLDK